MTETTNTNEYYINFVKQDRCCPICKNIAGLDDESEDIYV